MTKNNKMSNESVECPLCMETMDFDDVDFYPCPCRYQICRFCWDKIINEENGLCPACRKPYNSEHPASYKPRTEEEIKNKIKHSKKVCTKKIKPAPEGKEYLSEYRVLQKNLIFVVGLPMRMVDEVELLKGSEYFGRCGKVYKIVINQNQTFPGPQGTPCLSAYVTYHRNDDALKTLVDLKKLEIDGRAVKLSLGTTKYCSQFLRNRRCTKQDCMYLHEMGDLAASFTKDDMSNGKHTEYENQLIQEFFDNQKSAIVIPNVTSGPLATTTVTSSEPEKSTQRKSSLSSQISICTSCIPTTIILSSSVNSMKSHRPGYGCQTTQIGTVPYDASKIYSELSENCHSKSVPTKSLSEQCSSKDPLSSTQLDFIDINHIMGSLQCDIVNSSPSSSELPFINPQNHQENCSVSNSLLDSFYYLNSQASNTINNNNNSISHTYDQNINQQVNNNGLSNYSQFPYKRDSDFDRSFGSDKSKDTADIDFDPINISRLGLAELIANENRQKFTPYLPQLYTPGPQQPQRSMLRQSGHEFIAMQSGNDFYNNNNSNHRVSSQSFLHDKPSSMDGIISQQMSIGNIGNGNTSSGQVASISSGFPSPPPGFEVTQNNGCVAEPPTSDMMNMMMSGHNNGDVYNRYQSQHSTSDIPMSMNHHNTHYTNQYSIPPVNNYHEFGGFSNGISSLMGGGGGYNDLNNSQSQSIHPWKIPLSEFCDNGSLSQEFTHNNGLRSSVGYNRSHSMNENTGIRHSEWNGFTSYNGGNDSHTTCFPDGNSFLLSSLRGQSAQCAAVTTVTSAANSDGRIYQQQQHRQQTSHSVNH